MNVKENFELIMGKTTNVFNVYHGHIEQLKPYMVDMSELMYLNTLCNMFGKTKSDIFSKFVSERIKTVFVVRLPDYPLPGFVTKDMKPVVNIAYLTDTLISDYSASDIYSMFTYAIVLQSFISRKPFDKDIADHIEAFYFLIFIKLFGKKSGILGSYSDLIPKLRLLINLYVESSIMGEPITYQMIRRNETKLYMDASDINLDFNFKSTTEFLRAIKQNNIIPISENKFSQTIINISGISSLPMFEDVSRFFATLIASNVAGNGIFSHYWKKIKPEFFNKMLITAHRFLK